MSITDPIADMLTVIRNAQRIKKEKGYIVNYRRIEDGRQGVLRVYLRYSKTKSGMISGLKRISKPGLRIYVSKEKIPSVFSGTGVAIISTGKGILADKEARSLKVGGEVICYLW